MLFLIWLFSPFPAHKGKWERDSELWTVEIFRSSEYVFGHRFISLCSVLCIKSFYVSECETERWIEASEFVEEDVRIGGSFLDASSWLFFDTFVKKPLQNSKFELVLEDLVWLWVKRNGDRNFRYFVFTAFSLQPNGVWLFKSFDVDYAWVRRFYANWIT